jgi:general secretion pathway protein A
MTNDPVFDYLEYWGLSSPPFSLAPCPQSLFLSRQHGECLLRLKYAVMAGKGGALLISENAGAGKTTLLRRLCNDLRADLKGRVQIAFIDHPTLTPVEMLQEISRQVGIVKPYRSKVRALGALREHLMKLHDLGEKCVIIVDEGQMLEHDPSMLQELRILLNLYRRDAFLLSFILSGQRALEPVIRGMPEFWQRLPVRFFLGNLDLPDTRRLIQHRLHCVGLAEDREIFTTRGYERLYAFSEGCPRVICSIADLSLVVGRSSGVRQIDAPQVVQAHADMEKPISDGYHYYHFVRSVLDSKDAKPDPPAAAAPPPLSRPAPPPPADNPSLRVIPVPAQRRRPTPPRSRARVGRRRSWFRRLWISDR